MGDEDGTTRVLWGAGTTRTVRVHWALQELGLPYRTEPILPRSDAMEREDFKALSRRGKVPLLQEGDRVIGESGAIVLHLAERHEEGPVRLSVTPELRPEYYDLCFFVLTELDATSLYVLRRHEGLPEIYGEAPTANEAARAYFLRQVTEMERRLGDGRPYLLGERFTSPDLLLMTCLDWARFLSLPVGDTLDAYRVRIAARPAYQAAVEANFAPVRRAAEDAAR